MVSNTPFKKQAVTYIPIDIFATMQNNIEDLSDIDK
jgi:hypothetical protein